jgi:hypothetical protein
MLKKTQKNLTRIFKLHSFTLVFNKNVKLYC